MEQKIIHCDDETCQNWREGNVCGNTHIYIEAGWGFDSDGSKTVVNMCASYRESEKPQTTTADKKLQEKISALERKMKAAITKKERILLQRRIEILERARCS